MPCTLSLQKVNERLSTTMWVRMATICALACAAAGSLGAPRVATAAGSSLSPRAATEADPCFNLDLVFIIDQSGSMSLSGSANDPDQQRITAAVEMSRVLSDISLDECPGALHRMAVVSFGTLANVDLELTKIGPDTLSEVAAKIRASDLDMGMTDPDRGFELAANELKQAAPEGDRPRKRVIVFLTDGEPCVTALGCAMTNNTMDALAYIKKTRAWLAKVLPFDSQLLAQDACIAGLVQKYGDRDKVPGNEANACFTTHKVDEDKAYSGSTYIFTILLSATNRYTQSVVDVMSQISTEHGGSLLRMKQNARDIPVMLRKIVSTLAGVKVTQLQCGNFAVNPYLQKVTLSISRITKDLNVTISYTDVDNQKHTIAGGVPGSNGGFDPPASGPMYKQDGVNERYVFANPYPGIWNLYADQCDGFQAFYDPKKLSTKSSGDAGNVRRLLQYDQDPFFNSEEKFFLAYSMMDEADEVVMQAAPPRFAVEFKLVVTQPNGAKQPYEMLYLPATKQFQTLEAVQLPVAGKYQVKYEGSTHYRALTGSLGATADLVAAFPDVQELFSGSGEFEVLAVSPFRVQIDQPEQSADLSPVHRPLFDGWQWPLPVTDIEVRARLVKKDGGVLPKLSEVLEDPAKATLTLFVGSGSEGVEMTRVGETAQFEATIKGYATLGDSTVTVVFAGSATDTYRPEVTVEQVDACAAATLTGPQQGQRTCASVGIIRGDPGLWNRELTYRQILWLLIALVLAWLGRIIWGRTNRVRGRLVFGVGAEVLHELGLYSGRRITRLKLQRVPELMLREVRVRYQGRAAPDIDEAGVKVPKERGVRLEVVNLKGQRVKMELSPGEEVRYLEEFPKKLPAWWAAGVKTAGEGAEPGADDGFSQAFMRFEQDAA